MGKNDFNSSNLDFIFDASDLDFKYDLCTFLQSITTEIKQINANVGEPDFRQIYRLIGTKGYLAPSWPTKYGGLSRSMVAMGIVSEEMAHHNVGDTLQVLSIFFAGNLILKMGSTTQKQKYLGSLAKGDIFMSILYSEKYAGSDLAALEMQAIDLNNGYYELSGTKIYNVKSLQADYALCATRTNKTLSKYEGITLFIVPLQVSQVKICKIPSLMNELFCEVKFDKLKVHESEIIGKANEGWYMLNNALYLERTGLDLLVKFIRWVELLNTIICLGCCVSENKAINLYNYLNFKLINAKYYVYNILKTLDEVDTLAESTAATAKYYLGELSSIAIKEIIKLVNWRKINNIREADGYSKNLELALREIPSLTLAAGTSEIMLESIAKNELYLN